MKEIKGNVSLDDSTKLDVQGKGTIKILQKDGKTAFIINVYYVPNMKSNILNIRQLLERVYIIHMEDKFLALRDAKRQLVAKAAMSNNIMFPIYLNTFVGTCLLVKDSELWRWHLRFGHLNFDGLQLLKAGMVHGLPKIEKLDHVCEVCTLGKQHRLPFPKGRSWRANQPLQLVHTDICGPLVPVSHGGNKYLIIFIDDYSRKT
jgi:GAG-pre-integrase domain